MDAKIRALVFRKGQATVAKKSEKIRRKEKKEKEAGVAKGSIYARARARARKFIIYIFPP